MFSPKPKQKTVWLDLTDSNAPKLSCNAQKAPAGAKSVVISQLQRIEKGYSGCPQNDISKTLTLASATYTLIIQFPNEVTASGFEGTVRYFRYCVSKKTRPTG